MPPAPPQDEVADEFSTPIPEDPGKPLHPIPGVFSARETHLLSGASGAGKTTWIGWFLAQIATEPEIWGYPVQRPPFIGYIAGDRTSLDAREKFERAGWPDPACYGVVDDQDPEIDRYLKRLVSGRYEKVPTTFPHFARALELFRRDRFPERDARSPVPPDSLIVVDGMAPLFGIEPAGSYLKNVAGPLLLLNRLCRRQRLTILLVHHAAKQVADRSQRYARPQDRTLGSMALLGFTSTQLFLEEPVLTGRDDELHTLTVVSHTCKPFAALYGRADNGRFFQVEGGPAVAAPNQEPPMTVAAAVEEAMNMSTQERVLQGMDDVLRAAGTIEAAWKEGVPAPQVHAAANQRCVAAGRDPISKATFHRLRVRLEELGHLASWKVGRESWLRILNKPS